MKFGEIRLEATRPKITMNENLASNSEFRSFSTDNFDGVLFWYRNPVASNTLIAKAE